MLFVYYLKNYSFSNIPYIALSQVIAKFAEMFASDEPQRKRGLKTQAPLGIQCFSVSRMKGGFPVTFPRCCLWLAD